MTCQLTPVYPSQAAVPAQPLPPAAPVETQPELLPAHAAVPQEHVHDVALLHAPDVYGPDISTVLVD